MTLEHICNSDDDPDVRLWILDDGQGDIWISIFDPEKGRSSVRLCTLFGGGHNLELRKAMHDFLQEHGTDTNEVDI